MLAERVTDEARPSHTIVAASSRSMTVKTPLPAKPGAYYGSFKLTDRRFGHIVTQVGGVPVFVAGPRSATLRLNPIEHAAEAGKGFDVSISVANSGELTWAETPVDTSDPNAKPRNTRLVARWIPLDVSAKQVAAVDRRQRHRAAALKVDDVPLDAGRHIVIDTAIRAPSAMGRWALALDIVDDVSGSYAKLGSKPAVILVDVVAPRGRDSID